MNRRNTFFYLAAIKGNPRCPSGLKSEFPIALLHSMTHSIRSKGEIERDRPQVGLTLPIMNSFDNNYAFFGCMKINKISIRDAYCGCVTEDKESTFIESIDKGQSPAYRSFVINGRREFGIKWLSIVCHQIDGHSMAAAVANTI